MKQDLNELHRKRRALQKENTLKQVEEIVENHKTVIVENVSYRAWFTRYLKSMKLFTLGLFQSLLEKELSYRKGKLIKLHLQYAFSQTCYCETKVKKDLNNRVHTCNNLDCVINNKTFDRDLFPVSLMLAVKKT